MPAAFNAAPVVVLSSVDWDAAWQRHHAFAAQWARRGHRVYFVENLGFREPGWPDVGRVARRAARIARPKPPRQSAPEGVRVIAPAVLPPTRRVFRRLNADVLAPLVAAKLRRAGLRQPPIVFAYLPTATTLALLDALGPRLVVYDCVDNFGGHPSAPPDLERTEDALLGRSDLVLTTSRTLYDEKSRRHPRVIELHQGVPAAFFIGAGLRRDHRRFCYFGTIWDALDFAAIAALAQAGFSVDLIGPVKGRLPELPAGVCARAALPYDELPQTLAGYDALLLPYRRSDYNRGVVPAKTYECLATGLPVLSSPLPGLQGLSDVLDLADSPQDWVAAARALPRRETEERRRRRIERAESRRQGLIFDGLVRTLAAIDGAAAGASLGAGDGRAAGRPGWLTLALCLLAAALPLSIAATNLAVGLVSAVLLWKVREARRWRAALNPLVYALAFYCLAAAACSAAGVDPAVSFGLLRKDLHKLWIAVALLVAFAQEPAEEAAWPLMAGGAAAALIGVGQWALSPKLWTRAHAFVHPVTFGEQMGILLLGAACLSPAAAKVSRRWLGAAALPLSAGLLLSQTRAALIALAAGLAAAAALRKPLRRWVATGLAVVALGVLSWHWAPSGRRLGDLVAAGSVLDASGQLKPQFGRLALWQTAWRVFRDRPWLGVGPGNFRTVYPSYYRQAIDNELVVGSAHNVVFHQLAERGLLGALALALLLWTLAAGAVRRALERPDAWTAWAAAAVAAFLVMNVTEVALQNEQVTTLVLFLWTWADGRGARS